MTKARDHNEGSLQFCPKLGRPLGPKSETPSSQNTERNYSTLFHKAHKDQWSILSPELSFCTFPQKRIEEKILCTTLSPKFPMIPLRHSVPHTAAVRKWDCCKLEKKTKHLVLAWPWYIHQPGDKWSSCTRSTNRRNAWITHFWQAVRGKAKIKIA